MNIGAIIIDWKRTLYDPDTKTLIDGSQELLQVAQELAVPLYLIGKGGEDMYAEARRLGVHEHFTEIVFQEGAKEEGLFRPFITKNPKETLFIGDRIRSELAAGKSLGATTLWVRQGKFAEEMPENDAQKPDYTVSSLSEARVLLTQLMG